WRRFGGSNSRGFPDLSIPTWAQGIQERFAAQLLGIRKKSVRIGPLNPRRSMRNNDSEQVSPLLLNHSPYFFITPLLGWQSFSASVCETRNDDAHFVATLIPRPGCRLQPFDSGNRSAYFGSCGVQVQLFRFQQLAWILTENLR